MSGNISRRDPGIALAVATPPLGSTNGSRRPWMTSVGAATDPNAAVRSGLAAIAMIWWTTPAGS